MNAEAREFWAGDARMYGTVLLCCKACDYAMSLAKQPNEPGFLIEGDRLTPTDMHEAWTFVRHQYGKWLLCAIQQVHS
jgi:predicted lipid-binding transport protein (Tim44 family)